MKTRILLSMIAMLCSTASAFPQFGKTVDVGINAAFFVNNCNQRIEELNCYDFNNFMIAWEMKPHILKYDYFKIELFKSNEVSDYRKQYSAIIETEILNQVFGEMEYGYALIFESGGNVSANFTTTDARGYSVPLKRAELAYTNAKEKNKHFGRNFLTFQIKGINVVGHKKKYQNNRNGSVTAVDVPITETDILHEGGVLKLNNCTHTKQYPLPPNPPSSGCYNSTRNIEGSPAKLDFK